MPVNFAAQKCACGGTLEFNPSKKVWICKYCGTVIEREATFDSVHVDGIEGINDVVRQTLMFIAYKRADEAERNLADCERKNHKHIGTLLANLSFNLMMIAITKDQLEEKNLLDKVKFYAKRLNDEFPVIDTEEINLYESFGSSASDIFGNLLIVFDTLNDDGRVEYISSKINTSEIFSQDVNKSLLRMALKNGKLDIADLIVSNVNNIDKRSSLLDVLNTYPDCKGKMSALEKLFDGNEISCIPSEVFQKYFTDNSDTIDTKNFVLKKLVDFDIKCNPEVIVKSLGGLFKGYYDSKETFNLLCKGKLTDNEIESLLTYTLNANEKFEVINSCFDALKENKSFVELNSTIVISLLNSSKYSLDEKSEILNRMLDFHIENKDIDDILFSYLCGNKDNTAQRKKLLDKLLFENCPISTSTIENYIVKISTDEKEKVNIIKMILETGFNKTYISDILNKYILSYVDEKNTKCDIVKYLTSLDFKATSKIVNQYVSTSKEQPDIKKYILECLIKNDTQIRSDCLDTYIYSLDSYDEYSSEIFDLLTKDEFSISENTFGSYLLYCSDAHKPENILKLIETADFEPEDICVTISHLNNKIECNVFQAYLLITNDNYSTAYKVSEVLSSKKIKLNTAVSINNKNIKFKKYISNNKESLSKLTLELCNIYKMFSIF